ncbi:hypothetical protein [Roseomonas sp. AR75]|uniref:hypothetical protein n=1 Tax=Roseomonas sp. AR75 TaxID=2562311 RepID=UPI0010C003E4|nr:hypothetical protein [Roseomonas sp. AR75]
MGLLFRGHAQQQRGSPRSATLRALSGGDGPSARRSMEADIGNALDWVIGLAEGDMDARAV